MAQTEPKSKTELDPDARYQYIGFEVFGKRVKEFFKSEDEKKKYEQQVKEYAATHAAPLRSGTAVKAELLPFRDKIVLTIASICLVAGSILPWFSVSSIYGDLTIPGITAFSTVAGFMNLLAQFSSMLPIMVYIFSALAVVSLLMGVLTLLMLYLPSKQKDAATSRLKKVLAIQYLPLMCWLGVFVYLIVGIDIPFGEDLSNIYAIAGLGSKFDIVTFWIFAQPALWLTIGSLIVNAIKSNDL